MAKPHLTLIAVSGFALVLAGCGSAGPATSPSAEEQATSTDALADAQSNAETAAETVIETKVLLENQQVRVTHISLPIGASMQPHDGSERAVYALADNEINWRPYGAVAERRRWPAGTVHFHEAGRHSLANLGPSPAKFVVFERLAAPLPTAVAATRQDIPKSSSDTAVILNENPAFRIEMVTLKPGEAQRWESARPQAVYALSDNDIEWQDGDAIAEKRQWQTGEALWHLAGRHTATNMGQTEASWLIAELKQ